MSSANSRGQLHGGDEQHPGESPGPAHELPAMILVADDSKTHLFLLQEILKNQGYRVTTAGNGAEALQKARQSPPDLIVTDILMPVMDGFSLCWEWTHDERLKRIPLICYTGTYTDDRNRQFALELGAERFVVNTGNPEDLIKVIREVLETSKHGGLAAVPPPVAENTVFLKQHNESLARKLEDKMRQLEQAHRGLQRDIAERKRAEEMQARLAAIVEHSNDAIIGRAIDGTITSWNAAAERILGYTAAEVIGRDPVEIFPPELRQMIAEHRKLLRAGQLVPNYETVRITKDGRRIEVSASVSAVRDASGRVIGIASILRDISDRKRLERELRHKTEIAQLLEQLARAANEAVSPEAAMEICLRYICEEGKWALGRVATFPPGLSPRKPDRSQWFCAEPARFDAFMRYSDGYEFKPGIGRFVGTVLCEQRPVWLPDLTVVEKLESRRLEKAVEAGLMAAFAFPVIVKGEVAAFLEFFATETRQPDALLIEGTTGLASQFARMIERSAADEARARLAAIVEHSNDAIVGRTVDGTVTSWNAAAERLFGYSVAEVIGQSVSLIVPPDLQVQETQRRAQLESGHAIPPYETERISKDGRRIPVALSQSAIRDEHGVMIGISAIFSDITYRKQAEDALRESEGKLRSIFEGALDGILVADKETRKFLSGNPAICRMLGYTLEEIVRIGVSDIHPKQDLPRAMEQFERLLRGESQMAADIPVMCKDGSVFYADIKAASIRIGGKDGLLGTFRDVTERKRAEETQARLAAIVECSNDAIAGRAVDGTVTSWNAAAERILGYTAAEVIGRNPVEIIPPELRQETAEWRNLIKAGQTLQNNETVRITKDGRRIDVTLSVSPIRDNSGNIMGTATILHDISELKRAEQILRNYTARLQTVSRKLLEVQEDEHRRLARELHDQVGQVLTALKINLQVIQRQPAAAPVALKIEECAQIADAALQQVRTLMLDLRPPQLDELGLAVALRTHAERVVTPANLVLHFSAPAVPPKPPPAIEIVCFRIMQEALTNILRHAGARNVWIELAVAGNGLKLTVRDDGKGFDLAEAHRRAMGGGSIGLLSMEERAALADGRLEISTAPGAGTTVRAMFTLPAAPSTVDTA